MIATALYLPYLCSFFLFLRTNPPGPPASPLSYHFPIFVYTDTSSSPHSPPHVPQTRKWEIGSQQAQLVFPRQTTASLAITSSLSCCRRIRYRSSLTIRFACSFACPNLGTQSFLSDLGPIE
ncbi:MAG: hypothetical protein EZS28_023752 [Streblomastix strix]|uniref:Uncharacterized protein n=1 Tax=Streblomastix strix TaxID=222440 RepID=A0A5J4VDX9_9EUKA|nr:MAG: hypothetical protein EZS28_023752 [Streblomastix strix]